MCYSQIFMYILTVNLEVYSLSIKVAIVHINHDSLSIILLKDGIMHVVGSLA